MAKDPASPRGAAPDLPPGTGLIGRLHLAAGSALILAVNLFRPPVTLGVRLVALDGTGRVFLVRHSYLPGWYLPGGGVERSETLRAAVIREAREEGGLILPRAPELFGVYFSRASGRRDHVALFVARAVTRDPAASRPSAEIVAADFHDPGALPEGTTTATRARLEEVLRGAPRSEHW